LAKGDGVEIKEKFLFKDKTVMNAVASIATPKKPYKDFSVTFPVGADQTRLKAEGMAILRILGTRFSKTALTNTEDSKKLGHTLSAEMGIKKGILPQNLAVMDALYNIFQNKGEAND
jgi:hypothetical protein